ncbi:MAG: aminoglycoside phosphotransferase, partial [Acidimicrobiales bacterium]|nr:aminoglycoside phosphotransferase [Acidimicrobiales bacterium]
MTTSGAIGAPGRARPNDPRFRTGSPDRQPAPPVLPDSLTGVAPGPDRAAWELVWVAPGSEVWRIDAPVAALYLKAGASGAPADRVTAETQRLRWLGDQRIDGAFRVPKLVGAASDGRGAWLVTAGLTGSPANSPELRVGGRPDELAQRLGAALRTFHAAFDPADCPFTRPVEALVASAHARLAAGGLAAESL